MRTRIPAFVAVALVHLVGASAVVLSQEGTQCPPPGFVALFDGKTLAGWHGMPHFDPRQLAAMSDEEKATKRTEWTGDAEKHWRVDDGELINDGQGAYLASDGDYGDIELRIDYKTVPKADSGIYLRGTPQVQIWDTTEEGGKWGIGADKGSGGLWNNSAGAPGKDPLVLADKPLGEWNSLRILQLGARTTVFLNDKLVVDQATMENYWDRAQPLFARGPIQLQTHGGEIRWRKIAIREVPPEESNKILADKGAEGFRPIFDGKGLDGWAGAVENYEVVEGALRCKPEKGGVLYHNQELSDFVARVEFRLPPGGNNGLAIRYSGKDDAAYSGMCELQVLDDTAEKYAQLDPRQYHGSVYGIVAAKRGFLRPVGQWNFQEVTVRGPRITVELNGTVIVDADVSQVHEYKDNSPHPGKDRTSGFFGFAGHGDPVEFRAIAIKPLN